MTPKRKKILRYGVALDAVLLVTGIALNFADISGFFVIVMFAAAVAIGAWRGGWGPALAGLALSIVSTLVFFHAVASAPMLAFLAVSGLIAAALGASAHRRATVSESIIPPETEPAHFDRADSEATLPDLVKAEESPRVEAAAPAENRDAPLEPAAPEAIEALADHAPESLANLAEEWEHEEPALEPEPSESEEAQQQSVTSSEKAPVVEAPVELPLSVASDSSEEEEATRLLEERLAANRALIEEALNQRVEREGQSDRVMFERLAGERMAAEREQAERAFQQHLTAERAAIQRRLAEQLATERAAMEREAAVRLAEERRAAKESISRQFESARAALVAPTATDLVSTSNRFDLAPATVTASSEEPIDADVPSQAGSDFSPASTSAATQTPAPPFAGDSQTIMTSRGPIPKRPVSKTPARAEPTGLFGSLWSGATGLFGRRGPSGASVNLWSRGPTPSPRLTTAGRGRSPAEARRPRLLLIERRRGMADTVLPELRGRGVEAEVVERWIDAIDEMFRFRPDALLVDMEIPDYERLLESLTGPSSALPVFLTGRSRPAAGQLDRIPNAGFLTRPYNAEELVRVAQQLADRPRSAVRRSPVPLPTMEPDEPEPQPVPPTAAVRMTEPPRPASPMPLAEPVQLLHLASPETAALAAVAADADYLVECFNCGGIHDAMQAEWCSCLTKERSLVCANCLSCFCKAPPSYKEKFWLEAPARLFERKSAELKHQQVSPGANPSPDFATRPLVLLVEDDENIQVIVQRVTTKLGYGFITASNGLDGLSVARRYKPDLILSDAFMPKLDGREMCRMLREEPGFEQCRMVVITGLYTDTKYKNEALKRFKVDEYIAKPVSIGDLVALLERYLVRSPASAPTPPPPEVRTLRPQQIIDEFDEWPEESIVLSDLMGDSVQDAEAVGFEVLGSTSPAVVQPAPRLDLESISEPRPESGAEAAEDAEQTKYEVCCFSCAELFDAAHAEWCSCVGHDQTLVCSECGNCFCKAPSLYKERFWTDAPPILFERKTLAFRRSPSSRENLSPDQVKRPLILLVEDDENIQLIVRTVVTTLGYGFIVAADGQEGLALAQTYKPELILSDAFMPKLDGREMCRRLKANPTTARAKAIIMTGLYTDRKYRNEAFDYFKVDDYVAKPLAVEDLMQLLRKHLPAEVQPTM